MNVYELNADQLEELKWDYFEVLRETGELDVMGDISYPPDIPDDIILEYYDGICFVEEDFFSSLDKEMGKIIEVIRGLL